MTADLKIQATNQPSWLLQLFQSHFFSPWMAIQYLHHYPEHVGIQEYLCERLKDVEVERLERYLPQVIHIAITQQGSGAVETLILDRCRASVQFAVLTWWLLRSYMAELPSGKSSDVCRKLLACLHDQHLPEEESAYLPRKPNHSVGSVVVAMTSGVLAIGSPKISAFGEKLALLKAQHPRIYRRTAAPSRGGCKADSVQDNEIASADFSGNASPLTGWTSGAMHANDQRVAPMPRKTSRSSLGHDFRFRRRSMTDSDSDLDLDLGTTTAFGPGRDDDMALLFQSTSSRGAVNGTRTIGEVRPKSLLDLDSQQADFDVSALGLSPRMSRKASIDRGRLGSSDEMSPATPLSPPAFEEFYEGKAFSFSNFVTNHSGPKTPPSRAMSSFKAGNSHHTGTIRDGDLGSQSPAVSQRSSRSSSRRRSVFRLSKSKRASQTEEQADELKSVRAFRSYYHFYTALSFFHHLADISERLVRVPKHARQAALQAELTLLNHNLPAPATLPFWNTEGAKVVRVAPEEAVVLNSAQRVPYMILIETVEDIAIPSKARRGGIGADPFRSPSSPASEADQQLPDFGISADEQDGDSVQEELKNIDLATELSGVEHTFQQKMRTAAVMLAQLDFWDKQSPAGRLHSGNGAQTPAKGIGGGVFRTEAIRNKILAEMMTLEDKRLEEVSKAKAEGTYLRGSSRRPSVVVMDQEDPSGAAFSETWEAKVDRIRQRSPYGNPEKYPGWHVHSLIVKTGADLRQEQLALQLISEIQGIWEEAGVQCWVYPYKVLVTSHSSGIIETVPNTISLHSLKKSGARRRSRGGFLGSSDKMTFPLYEYFITHFGTRDSRKFQSARDNFARSLAGYSLVTYILSIKDRHNGNILLDITSGHIVHIDFGFMFTNSPGNVRFETAPFKFTAEYMDILGTEGFDLFKRCLCDGFLAIRRMYERVTSLVQTMESCSRLPCFGGVETDGDSQDNQGPWSPNTLFWNARKSDQTKEPAPASACQQKKNVGQGSEESTVVHSQSASQLKSGTQRPLPRAHRACVAAPPRSVSATALDNSTKLLSILSHGETSPGKVGKSGKDASAEESRAEHAKATISVGGKTPVATSFGCTTVTDGVRDKFLLALTDQQVRVHLDQMITSSLGNVFTRLYDTFQWYSNGIMV